MKKMKNQEDLMAQEWLTEDSDFMHVLLFSALDRVMGKNLMLERVVLTHLHDDYFSDRSKFKDCFDRIEKKIRTFAFLDTHALKNDWQNFALIIQAGQQSRFNEMARMRN